jgi:hypothetical protein
MIFNFIQSYSSTGDRFKIDIPVDFVIPKIFNSLKDLYILSSYNKEVCDILSDLGITLNLRCSVRVTRAEVIVYIKNREFDKIKTIIQRDQKLKELLD